ncbi:hypothetical protein PYW07_005321 [Mythimna separata]|uniref:Uncharacterized protein n=1 Tax=Mythimna separata TaxID=271217 RepID=A0AAD8DPU9_MYTSE|nr:hypothetical protein PYW07_005321 [Mythimna separata]
MEDQDTDVFLLENADINSDVVTLKDLSERREILLEKKREILNKQTYQNETKSQTVPIPASFNPASQNQNLTSEFTTLTTVLDPALTQNEDDRITYPIELNVNVIEHNNDGLDFPSDDSSADPSFVLLSDITNLKPLSPENVEWFPEREIEQTSKKNNKRRKGNPNNWERTKNKRQRMMGQEYTGFKKDGNKYVQNDPKPAKTMGPLCMSSRCFGGKAMYCSKLTEEVRSNIFKAFWNMSWQEKKMYVSSMVDLKPTTRKTKKSNSRRSDTKIYYLKVNDKKERVCLKTFLETLGIKEWTVRYWLGEKKNKSNESEPRDTSVTEPKRELVRKYLTALKVQILNLPIKKFSLNKVHYE